MTASRLDDAPSERPEDTDRSTKPGIEAARSLFSKFRTILDSNTAILTAIAGMESMLGGEYIFDRAFLEKSAREIADLTHRTVYALNAMTGNRFVALYDRFAAIGAEIEDILAGREGMGAETLILPLREIRLEDRGMTGDAAAALAEIAGRLELAAPDGFAVTEAGWREAVLPNVGAALERAVAEAVVDLYVRRGSKFLSVETEAVLPDGEIRRGRSNASCEAGQVVNALRQSLEEAMAAFAGPVPDDADAVRARSLVLEIPEDGPRGEIRTLARRDGGRRSCPPLLEIRVRLGDAADSQDRYFVKRSHPYALRESRIAPKPLDRPLPDGKSPADLIDRILLRGSAVLLPDQCAALAGAAMAAERLLGEPLLLRFAKPHGEEAIFYGVRPLAADPDAPDWTSEACEAGEDGDILLRGGAPACLGAASGTIIHVREGDKAEDFPYGALAVARSASPQFAPLLKRAAGMVAEVGDAAGHLAAVAREFRVPALFGAKDALAALPQGLEATLDAEARTVTRGASAPARPSGWELSPADPEYLLLRRLLQRISSLSMIDPQAKTFTAQNCRSFHDIIHFAHENAVEYLATMRAVGTGRGAIGARPLDLPTPLDLRILDIGGAVLPGSGSVSLDAVRSRPLAAFLRGVCAPGMWDQTPANLGIGDILSGMDKSFAALSGKAAYAGENLAIAAKSYCNISLRLGYHFSVLDAYLSENASKNSIYFRFVGGVAPIAARARRASFLRNILARFDFKVEVQGDLVVARLKMIEPGREERILFILGQLTAFTRQRDTGLLSDADAAALENAFLSAAGLDAEPREGGASHV
jgi:pyruvate, water dikinase